MITHELEVIKYACHRMAVMEDGRLLEQGLVKEIFRHPKCETARNFISVYNRFRSEEEWDKVMPAIGETMYMVAVSSVFVLIFGVLLGLILVMTSKEGLVPCKVIHSILGAVINCFRSLPQVIIIIVMLPVARALVGKSYGSNACIISLIASCVPLFARLVESSLLEIDKGKIEAAKAMGSGNMRIPDPCLYQRSRDRDFHDGSCRKLRSRRNWIYCGDLRIYEVSP